jgi:hypothetical protein
MNQGRLEVIDDIYDPALAPAARRWIEPFLQSFSDVDMQIVQLVEEADVVVRRFTCSASPQRRLARAPGDQTTVPPHRGGVLLPSIRPAHHRGVGTRGHQRAAPTARAELITRLLARVSDLRPGRASCALGGM